MTNTTSPRSSAGSKMLARKPNSYFSRFVLLAALVGFAPASAVRAYEVQAVSPVLEMVDHDLKKMYPGLGRYEIREIPASKIQKEKLPGKLEKELRRKLDTEFESIGVSRTLYLVYDRSDSLMGVVFGMTQRLHTGTIQLFIETHGLPSGALYVKDLFVQRSDSPDLPILKDPEYLRQFQKFSTQRVPERAWVKPPLSVDNAALNKDVLADHHAFVSAVKSELLWLRELKSLL